MDDNTAAAASTSTNNTPSRTGATAPTDGLPDNAAHVLVVDDDDRISDLVKRYLMKHGYRATTASSAANARQAMTGLAFDAIVLDIRMPGESGLDLARHIRQTSDIPILFATANTETHQVLEGFDVGADDYLRKPYDPSELVVRIETILRRVESESASTDEIRMGEFTFVVSRGDLRNGNQSVKITERERELLRQFAQSVGHPIARHELASSSENSGTERAVDVQINRLRRKIEADPSNPVYLQTVRGKGYILHVD